MLRCRLGTMVGIVVLPGRFGMLMASKAFTKAVEQTCYEPLLQLH